MSRILIALLGAFGLIIPLVGPLFGFGMGMNPQPWVIDTSRLILHIFPGAAAIIGGLMMFSRGNLFRWIGVTLALLGGIWLTIAPTVLSGGMSRGMSGMGPVTLIDVLRPLAYHYGTGLLITAFAAFSMGRMTVRKTAGQTSAARPAEPSRERPQRVR